MTQTHAVSVDGGINGGAEYDSNVSVQELDRVSNASDVARLSEVWVTVGAQPIDKLTAKARYRYSDKAYQTYGSYDQGIHTLSTDLSYNFTAFTLGGSYHYAKAVLDSDAFLTLEQASVYATKLWQNRYYLRVAANDKQKTFADNADRDAEALGFSADLFVFFNNTKSFVSFGIERENEDANAEQFSNHSTIFRSKLSNNFTWLTKANSVSLELNYLDRDYQGYDFALLAPRSDIRRRMKGDWTFEFTPHISAATSLEYGRYSSNQESADYNETVASVMVEFKF